MTAIESASASDQVTAGTSSGSSTAATSASGGPAIFTVLFNDGTQGRYIVERPIARHVIGEPVYVLTDSDRITIAPR